MRSDLIKLATFIEEMKATSSTNSKKEILKKHDSFFLRRVLEYVYNPFKQFNVTSDNLRKNSNLSDNVYSDLFVMLDDLNERRITGHTAIAAVNGFINQYPEFTEILYDVIDRNIKTRATGSLINKVFPKTVPVFEVALAQKFRDHVKKVDFESRMWWASRKLDGCLNGDSVIEFDDGKKLKIKEVVEQRIPGKIKSYNVKTNKIEYKKILDWMKNLSDINHTDIVDWYDIVLENGKILRLTGNHRVWLPMLRCWRRVDELEITDSLLFE